MNAMNSDERTLKEAPQRRLQQDMSLLFVLLGRDISARYRGSILGIFWSILTPLMMLGVFTFVFGVVFRSRWTSAGAQTPVSEFAVILFSGLIIYTLLAETLTKAPSLVLANPAYVKKVVFPLHLLVPVAFGSALFQATVSLVILLPFIYLAFGQIPVTAFLIPLIILPYTLVILGFGWFLASLGTFVRDVGQFIGTLMTALMFLAPIFFPMDGLPDWMQPVLYFNPVTVPVEQVRAALVFGDLPNMTHLGIYSAISIVICLAGYRWFQATKKGFADVV